MSRTSEHQAVRDLLHTYGSTYAEEAGIRLRNTPQPLYQLLVLAFLLSARISSGIAVASARALSDAGLRSPRRMAAATWQERVDALGRGGYRRFDERTSTQLGEGADLLQQEFGGDVRKLRAAADRDTTALRRQLQRLPGLGPVGADIFLREVQGIWPEVAPFFDQKAQQGARRVGLPDEPEALARLADDLNPARFASALVRAALDKHLDKHLGEHLGEHLDRGRKQAAADA
jgi:endonuclease III